MSCPQVNHRVPQIAILSKGDLLVSSHFALTLTTHHCPRSLRPGPSSGTTPRDGWRQHRGSSRPYPRRRTPPHHRRRLRQRPAPSSFRTSPQKPASPPGATPWALPQKKFILETIGSGVALLDYDNDGWLDIYLVNGSTYDALAGKAAPPHAALFHNNHDGTFTDVAAKAGVTNDRWGFGVAVGDYDNDGWPDLFVANYGKNRLYHNNHDGTFTDVAEKAGVTLGNWSTGATWGDYDGDGRLDLFVPGYVHYDHGQAARLDGSGVAQASASSAA